MVAKFYSFSKRRNSTKRPTEGKDVTFVYKDSTDLHNPIIDVTTDVSDYNYAKIGDIYFFVNSMQTIAKNLWRVGLTIDLLATYKADIQNTASMVMYSSSVRNPHIIDDRIITLPTYNTTMSTFYPDHISVGGTYFVRVMGKEVPFSDVYNSGLTPVYMMSSDSLKRFIEGVTVDGVFESIKNYFTNAMDGFIECYWLPFSVNNNYANGTLCTVSVGGASIDCGAIAITNNLSNFSKRTKEITIPWQYDDFRNNEPYSALYFYTPWSGLIKLNASDFYGYEKITVDYALDIFNGDITFNLKVGDRVISTICGNAKINLPLSQITVNASGVISGAVASVGGVAYAGMASKFMKSPKMAIATGIATSIGGMFSAFSSASQNEVASKGNMSGTVNANTLMGTTPCALYVVAQNTLVDPINNASIVGYPLGAVRSLNGLDGFVQTTGASVSAKAYESEISRINNLLDGGVYIE